MKVATAILFVLISAASAQRCEPPSNGCTYGMFNYDKCLCECIKPFCPDANGDCVLPTDNCGGNPWAGCTRGLDCPWWGSLSNDSVCNTGSTVSLDLERIYTYLLCATSFVDHHSHIKLLLLYIDQVPAGVWSIYNTREICCGAHAPFSSTCETIGPNGPVSSSNDDLETGSAIDRPQSAFETSSASSTSNTAIMSYTNGQPGWAIALMIVIPLLVLLCCIGYCYCIFVRDNDQDQEEKDVVVKRTNRSSDVRGRPRRRDDGKSLRCSRSRYDSFHSSLFTGRTSRARYPRRSRGERSRKDNDGPSISLSNPQDPRFSADEFTVHTYTTMKKTAQDPQMTAIVLHEPNYEKPDPEGETTAGAIALALTNGHDKIRSVEPDMKPKLEPEESDTKQKAGPFVSSFVTVKAQKRIPGRRRTVDTSTSDNEDDNDNGSYGFRFSQPHIYAPTRKNEVSEELKGSFVTFTTKGTNEEELTLAKKSINKKKERDSSSSSSSSSSNSRKRFEESRRRRRSSLTLLSFEERERAKEQRAYSGVRSIGSIELETI